MTTATEQTDRDRLLWRIKDIVSRVRPEDMTSAELVAVIAILRWLNADYPAIGPPPASYQS